MSAAPSWPLISSPALGAPSGTRLPPLPGLNFSNPFWWVGSAISDAKVLNCSSDLQNAKRRAGRRSAPARHNHDIHGLQKPEIACSPNGLQETAPSHRRAFVLSLRYGAIIVEIRGASPQIPTLFRVRPASGCPVARLLL